MIMVAQQEDGQRTGEPDHEHQATTGPNSNKDLRERQKIVDLKVTHFLLTVFFLWLTYVTQHWILQSD